MCGREFISAARLRRGLKAGRQAGRQIIALSFEPTDKQHNGPEPKTHRGVFSSLLSHTALEEFLSCAAQRRTDVSHRCHPFEKTKKPVETSPANASWCLLVFPLIRRCKNNNYEQKSLHKTENVNARRTGSRIATNPRNSFGKRADTGKWNRKKRIVPVNEVTEVRGPRQDKAGSKVQ